MRPGERSADLPGEFAAGANRSLAGVKEAERNLAKSAAGTQALVADLETGNQRCLVESAYGSLLLVGVFM